MTQKKPSLSEQVEKAKDLLVEHIQTFNLTISQTYPERKEIISVYTEARKELEEVLSTLTALVSENERLREELQNQKEKYAKREIINNG